MIEIQSVWNDVGSGLLYALLSGSLAAGSIGATAVQSLCARRSPLREVWSPHEFFPFPPKRTIFGDGNALIIFDGTLISCETTQVFRGPPSMTGTKYKTHLSTSLPNAVRILEKFQLYLSNLVIKVTVTPQWFIAIPGKPCTSWTWRSSGAAGGRSQSTDWRPWEKFVDDKFTLPTLQVLISLWIRGQHARNSFRGSHENHLATRSEIIGNLQLLLKTIFHDSKTIFSNFRHGAFPVPQDGLYIFYSLVIALVRCSANKNPRNPQNFRVL